MKSATQLRKSRRRGTAAVEFAVCLPILTAFVLGVIEVSNAVFLQQALTSAAYEASNVASAPAGSAAAAQIRANQVLTSLGINSGTITISPAVTPATALGTQFVVTVSAPTAGNLPAFGYISRSSLSAVVTTAKL